ncbi:hypothetical protein [Nitratireductor rhodophyticola]|uniref:hypothetical protein n=1 Tax=Nitratireductor rhodophyticola TaxID=2854036 RepID=UPI001CA65ACD|nr:hypothetical protein [Nitratireductor rhodophyticola]
MAYGWGSRYAQKANALRLRMKPETTAINRTASRLRRFQTIAFNAVTNAMRRRSGVKKFLVNKGLTKPATPADKNAPAPNPVALTATYTMDGQNTTQGEEGHQPTDFLRKANAGIRKKGRRGAFSGTGARIGLRGKL